jgi:pilus assembly protein CpaE
MKVTIIGENAEVIETLKKNFTDIGAYDTQVSSISSGGKADINSIEIQATNLLIFDCIDSDHIDWESIESFNIKQPTATILLIYHEDSPDVLVRAMHVGVRDVLKWPVSKTDLISALARVRGRIVAGSLGAKTGKIFAFVPCKGGSGTSFISSNLAYVLSDLHHKKVLLIDLDLHMGDASFYISDDESSRSLADIIRQPVLDGSMLESACVQLTENFSLLRAPPDLESSVGITPAQVDNLLSVASRHYDFIFVDLERALDPISVTVLDKADIIFPVMQTMLAFVRGTKRMQRSFKALHYPDSKIRLIANRFDSRTDLPIVKIEEALQTQFYKVIPNDFITSSEAMNSGKPVHKVARDCALTQAIVEIANDLAGSGAPLDIKKDKKRSGWLGSLLGS